MKTGSRSVDVSDCVGHAGLEAWEGGEMNGLGRVIFWEGTNSASVMLGAFAREEPE